MFAHAKKRGLEPHPEFEPCFELGQLGLPWFGWALCSTEEDAKVTKLFVMKKNRTQE